MSKYLLKILYLLIFALTVIFTYYGQDYSFHIENFDGYTSYVVIMLIAYFLYKGYHYISGNKTIVFTPLILMSYFLLHLAILSILFFSLGGNSGGLGITLFVKIIGFLLLPTLIVFLSISVGKTLLSRIGGFLQETSVFQLLFSLGIGFFLFASLLSIAGFFGQYNFISVVCILGIFLGISFKELGKLLKSFVSYKIEIDNHDFSQGSSFFSKLNLYLLSSEFFFIVLTFLISVNFINIVRPMPIGWDDLGVYMNYPNLMAASGKILPLGMAVWQVFTGIGFMFGSATQSFFLNNVGSILGILTIVLSFQDLLKVREKNFINIPLFCATIFLSMPMVIFQQAKDMKLDPGLFFVSAIILYLVLYIFLKYLGYSDKKNVHGVEITTENTPHSKTVEMKVQTKNNFFAYFQKYTHIGQKDLFSHKSYLTYILLIGILAGFAFTIKVTTLLLISGILGMMFYSKLGMAGLFSYLSIYVGIFTKFGLWDMMFVVYPKDDLEFRNTFFLVSCFVGILLFSYAIYKYSFYSFKKLVILVMLFLLGVGIGGGPRFIKNIFEAKGDISIGTLLGGKPESFVLDYKKIYTQDQLNTIDASYNASQTVNASGTTSNEDFGRYFGYEKGINNYVKLPYNLTMQVNQRGEFTDITYYYFALVPVIVLFLAFKFEILSLGAFLFTLIPFGFFFNNTINSYFTQMFTQYDLPGGYIILAIFFFLPFIYFMYSLNNEKRSVLFKLNLVFAVFYIFLWSISAFGVVWYGVAMYYSLLFMIAIGGYYITEYDQKDVLSHNPEIEKKLLITFIGTLVFAFISTIYIFDSVFPHGFTNLRSAGYESYKSNQTNNYISIFESHSDYYDALSELNIKKEKQKDLLNYIVSQSQVPALKNIVASNKIDTLISLNNLFKQIASQDSSGNSQLIQIQNDVVRLRTLLYKNILYPTPEYKNTIGIYRIGTFLKYFIADNYNRLLEDSLIDQFYRYFYNKDNVNLGVDRMKKIGVGYFLVDLNAATIDKDPRHDLTKRYESLLHTFTSDKLDLIQTDSICLRIALDDYKKSGKTSADYQRYLELAGGNYESYTQTGGVINRGVKQIECYNYILELLQNKKVSETQYSYLIPIANYLNQNKITSQNALLDFFKNYVGAGWMALFRIQ